MEGAWDDGVSCVLILFMSFEPKSVAPETFADRQEDAAYYRRVLHELIDRGADMARMVHERAKAQADGAERPDAETEAGVDLTVPFDRIARCVRRCLALARRLDEPVVVRDGRLERVAGRKQVLRKVEDAIHRDAPMREADGLRAELYERLDGPEFDDDLLTRSVAEIVAEIRNDLGIGVCEEVLPSVRRRPADVAALCARAAAPARAGGSRPVLDVVARDTC